MVYPWNQEGKSKKKKRCGKMVQSQKGPDRVE